MNMHGKHRLESSSGRWFRWTVLILGGLMIAGAAYAGEFGTRCQQTFDNGWQPALSYVYDRCSGFNDRMDDNNTKLFYFTVNDGSGFTGSDGSIPAGGVDTVDVFYVSTHGGVTDPAAVLARKPANMYTVSFFWRFGDNSNRVAIFSQYACKTMQLDDKAFGRWVNAFKGGLYLATGSHDLVYDSWTTSETGEDYADNLAHGKTVKWAWIDGNDDCCHDQDVVVYASSSGPLSECQQRRDTMTGQNVNSFTRLRDGSMNRICAEWITDD